MRAARRRLNAVEALLSAGLLVIPYVTRGYDNAMLSAAWFATVVRPAYPLMAVMGRRVPEPARGLLFALAGFYLGAVTGLYAARFSFF